MNRERERIPYHAESIKSVAHSGGALLTGAVGLPLGLIWLWGGRNLWARILLHGIVDFIGATEAYTAGPGT